MHAWELTQSTQKIRQLQISPKTYVIMIRISLSREQAGQILISDLQCILCNGKQKKKKYQQKHHQNWIVKGHNKELF